MITGEPSSRSRCEPFRQTIRGKLEQGLSAQRIWQDLREDGFADGCQSVQRFARHPQETRGIPFRRMECEPGQQVQVGFGFGAPVVMPERASTAIAAQVSGRRIFGRRGRQRRRQHLPRRPVPSGTRVSAPAWSSGKPSAGSRAYPGWVGYYQRQSPRHLPEDLVPQGALVPPLGPAQPVEQAVQFRFARPGPRAVPATPGAFALRAIPIRAAFRIQGELDQAQAHHQAAAVHGKQPRQLSFTRACQTVLASWILWSTGSCRNPRAMRAIMLEQIAANEVGNRPGRIEPRVFKRPRHHCPLMQRPREKLRAALTKT